MQQVCDFLGECGSYESDAQSSEASNCACFPELHVFPGLSVTLHTHNSSWRRTDEAGKGQTSPRLWINDLISLYRSFESFSGGVAGVGKVCVGKIFERSVSWSLQPKMCEFTECESSTIDVI